MGVLVRGHAGLVIKKLSKGIDMGGSAPKPAIAPTKPAPALPDLAIFFGSCGGSVFVSFGFGVWGDRPASGYIWEDRPKYLGDRPGGCRGRTTRPPPDRAIFFGSCCRFGVGGLGLHVQDPPPPILLSISAPVVGSRSEVWSSMFRIHHPNLAIFSLKLR